MARYCRKELLEKIESTSHHFFLFMSTFQEDYSFHELNRSWHCWRQHPLLLVSPLHFSVVEILLNFWYNNFSKFDIANVSTCEQTMSCAVTSLKFSNLSLGTAYSLQNCVEEKTENWKTKKKKRVTLLHLRFINKIITHTHTHI